MNNHKEPRKGRNSYLASIYDNLDQEGGNPVSNEGGSNALLNLLKRCSISQLYIDENEEGSLCAKCKKCECQAANRHKDDF